MHDQKKKKNPQTNKQKTSTITEVNMDKLYFENRDT